MNLIKDNSNRCLCTLDRVSHNFEINKTNKQLFLKKMPHLLYSYFPLFGQLKTKRLYLSEQKEIRANLSVMTQ